MSARPSTPAPRRLDALAALAAALVLFVAAYAGSWRNAFHFDDTHVVESNPAIRSLATVPRLFTDARTFSSLPANQTYRPLVSLTLAVDHAVARATTGDGLDPRAYHATQLAWLALVAALLGLLGWRLFAGAAAGDDSLTRLAAPAALVAATLFAVHVGNSQVGNYISARSESLSAAGLLGAFLLYLRGGRWRRWHLYLLPMALGALAKPPAILFAPLLLLWRALVEEELGPAALRTAAGRRSLWRAALGTVPAFAAAIALYLFVEGMNPPGQTYGGGSLPQYLWTQAWVSLRYLGLFVLPTGLSADSDWTLLPSPLDARVLAGVAVLALSLWAAWRAAGARRTRPIALGILWFWIGLAPTAVVPLAEVTNDHRPFVGFLGLTLAAVWGVVLLLERVAAPAHRARVGAALAAAVLVAHTLGTRERSRVWATDASLWASVVRESPGNARGLMNYGLTAMGDGRFVEARALFDSAARLAPTYPLVFVNRGIAAGAQGDSAAAEADFQRALELDPASADAHRYYARWLAERGRGPEALAHYARAVALRPQDVGARTEQLLLLTAAGTPDAAVAARAILALDPGDATAQALAAGRPSVAPLVDSSTTRPTAERWYLAGWALTQIGQHAQAIQAYRAAVAADSTYATAWNNLGWSLGRLGFFDAALPALERAVTLSPADTLARNNLAWVRAAAAARPAWSADAR
jgi:tetratricopeptide (TPR) repeat protein